MHNFYSSNQQKEHLNAFQKNSGRNLNGVLKSGGLKPLFAAGTGSASQASPHSRLSLQAYYAVNSMSDARFPTKDSEKPSNPSDSDYSRKSASCFSCRTLNIKCIMYGGSS